MSVVIQGSDGKQATDTQQAIRTTNFGGVGGVESVHADVWDVEKPIYDNRNWPQAVSMADPDQLDAYLQGQIEILRLELNNVNPDADDMSNELEDLLYKLKYSHFSILKGVRKSLKATNSDLPKTDLLDIDHLLENDPTSLVQEDTTGNSLGYRTDPSFTYVPDDLGWSLISVTIQSAINDNTAKLIDPHDISNSSERLQRYQTMLEKLHASIASVLKIRNIGSGNKYDEAQTSPELNLINVRNIVNQKPEIVDQFIEEHLTPLGEFFQDADPDHISLMKNNPKLIDTIYDVEDFEEVVDIIIYDTLLLVSIYGFQGQKPIDAMTHLLNSVPKVLYYLTPGHPKTNAKAVLQATLHGLDGYLQKIDAGDVERDRFTKISEWVKKLLKIEDQAKALGSPRSDSVTQN
jgi:hypothetical protein